jgi:hypothetical protein
MEARFLEQSLVQDNFQVRLTISDAERVAHIIDNGWPTRRAVDIIRDAEELGEPWFAELTVVRVSGHTNHVRLRHSFELNDFALVDGVYLELPSTGYTYEDPISGDKRGVSLGESIRYILYGSQRK